MGSRGGLCCSWSMVVRTTIRYLWVDSVSFWNMTHSNSDGLDLGLKVYDVKLIWAEVMRVCKGVGLMHAKQPISCVCQRLPQSQDLYSVLKDAISTELFSFNSV